MEARVVIRNGVVPNHGPGTTVVVAGRRIAEIAPRGRVIEARPDDWDVDADGRLVVPGQVDAHAHLGLGALLRLAGLPGRAPAAPADFRAEVLHGMAARTTPERLEPLARAGALAALKAGVTTVLDVVAGTPGTAPELLDAEARALSTVGLRAGIACGARGIPGGGDGPQEILAVARFAGAHAAHPLLRGMVGLADLPDLPEEALDAAAELTQRVGLQACVGEDESDLARTFARWGRRPVEVLSASGLLGPRTIVAHAGTAVHAEGVAIADTGATLAIAPRAAMLRSAPLAPFLSFAKLGVQVAFGTDGVFPDPAGEAAAAAMALRHAERNAGAAAGLLGRVAWPAAARLASILFDDKAGVLAPGALADVVVLDWRPPFPLPDAPEGDLALLWAGAPAAWAVVDGRVRLREGRLLGGDEAEIAARASEAARGVLAV